MSTYCERLSNHLEGWTYDQAKESEYFEFIENIEKTVNSLSTEIFETLGVSADDETFNIAVKGIENFQEYQMNELTALSGQILSRSDIDEGIRDFVNNWAPGVKYQFSQKYYLKNGPNPKALNYGYVTVIQYFVPGCTYLANKFAKNDYKIEMAVFCENVLNYLIACLNQVKKNIVEYRKK